jgi:hypothetical protein
MDVNLLEKNKRIWLMVENNLPKLVKIKIESKERQDYKKAAEKGELFGVCSNCTGA